MNTDITFSDALIERGLILLRQNRLKDAESYFRQAIGREPTHAYAFYHLSHCLYMQSKREKEALDAIEQAIRLHPEESAFFAFRSHVHCHLGRVKEALASAQEALQIDPESTLSHSALAHVYLNLSRWSDAEKAARAALSFDPDHVPAGNQLSTALRMQKKRMENKDHLESMLGRDPEDEWTHANAGWAALERKDVAQAQKHFREALRLQPDFESARDGLLETFKARSPVYRAYLSYCFFMTRISRGFQWAVIVGLVVLVQLSNHFLSGFNEAYSYLIILPYFLMVLWVHVAPGVGNLMLLMDRFARLVLRQREKREALFVGGSVFMGLSMVVAAFLWESPLFFFIGGAVICAAFPFAHAFTNPSRPGRILFGCLGSACLLFAFFFSVVDFLPVEVPSRVIQAAVYSPVLISVVTTWLSSVDVLRRRS